jgi:hypothetical protein
MWNLKLSFPKAWWIYQVYDRSDWSLLVSSHGPIIASETAPHLGVLSRFSTVRYPIQTYHHRLFGFPGRK